MSAFTIYAIVLTLAYVIYYSAMITREAYASKDQSSDTSETFEFDGMDDPIESVTVNESKDGFYIGESTADDEEDINEEVSTDVPDGEETVSDAIEMAELHAASTEEMMEEVSAEYPDEFEPDEFDAVLLNPANTVPVIITTDTRDKL